jgi:hypothetical protein
MNKANHLQNWSGGPFPAFLKIFAVGLAARATGKEKDAAGGSFSWGRRSGWGRASPPKTTYWDRFNRREHKDF